MITAIDSSVLLDIFVPDLAFRDASWRALSSALSAGRVVASEVVWAEVSASFSSAREANQALQTTSIAMLPTSRVGALAAGRAWRAYRARGGTRKRLIADFLIGAHAMVQADRLLTRDAAFQRRNFPGLAVVDPTGD